MACGQYSCSTARRRRARRPTLEKRREVKRQFEREHAEALARGDLAEAYSKATMTSRLTREMVAEARELLRLLGLPTVQAPAEGEAQAAHMAATRAVWAAASKDYDTLLFGAPRPRAVPHDLRQGISSEPGHVPADRAGDADRARSRSSTRWRLTRAQLIDLAILVGTRLQHRRQGHRSEEGAAARAGRTAGSRHAGRDVRDAVGDPSRGPADLSPTRRRPTTYTIAVRRARIRTASSIFCARSASSRANA